VYDWSEEHQAIIAVVRRFVDEEIRPHLDDIEHNGVPPYEILRKMYVTSVSKRWRKRASLDNSSARCRRRDHARGPKL